MANFAKCTWPTSLQNQIDARTEAAWPPEASYVRGFGIRQVYANKPATIDELRTKIESEIAAVSADLCLEIVKNWVQRWQACPWWPCKRNRVSFIMASNVLL